jgi:hypothetical protein
MTSLIFFFYGRNSGSFAEKVRYGDKIVECEVVQRCEKYGMRGCRLWYRRLLKEWSVAHTSIVLPYTPVPEPEFIDVWNIAFRKQSSF